MVLIGASAVLDVIPGAIERWNIKAILCLVCSTRDWIKGLEAALCEILCFEISVAFASLALSGISQPNRSGLKRQT